LLNKTTGGEKMGRLTYTERLGLAKEVLKFIDSHSTELKNAGINPVKLAQELRKKIEANVNANDRQERFKASLYRSTDAVVEADSDMYVTASSYIDVLSGALRKDSQSSKVLRRLRSKAKMGPRPPKIPEQ